MIQSHAELVREQVERDKSEHSIGSAITAAHIKKWFRDKHGKEWTEVINDKANTGNKRAI